MKLFTRLKKIREYEIQQLPFLKSVVDFDIVIEIGYAPEQGQPLTLKQLFLLNIRSRTTVRRKLAKLIELGIIIRLKADMPKSEFGRFGPTMHLLWRYTQALITRVAQTAVCNRHHSVDQQLCRWLLLSLDRLATNELTMTQELIANMLGVRREGVTEAAGKLQDAGLIRYSRGPIAVLDRPRLEARSCECYQVVKREFDRHLPYAVK